MRTRLILVVGVSVAAGALAASIHTERASDVSLIISAARIWLDGGDPYAHTYQDFKLLYPFTAVLLGVPLSFVRWPDFWFIASGIGLYMWAVVTQSRFRYAWLALLTPGAYVLLRVSQWSALVTGAALIPATGFLLACKPTIGAALWCAFPSRKAVVSACILLGLSLVVFPTWPLRWLEVVRADTSHMQAPITFWGGPLLLLALKRWRNWEARLLVALACVPQTHFFYDTWPLWLIPKKGEQAVWLTGAAWIMATIHFSFFYATEDTYAAYLAERQTIGQLSVICLYLPCLYFVLAEGAERRARTATPLPDTQTA